ncbi:BLUF domain-containing protein [Paracoccus caeni]|uniref:BLUF domain-containing protein n=1 Tax=Paracoccus caeni TaxID=657651 RepID=A0A934SH03_9RHOB|nr:BLUF domain-containing protein [Paracoccus caeni]MBK4217269.1 BLUF domain-containing protein [Paracoccus caeni]
MTNDLDFDGLAFLVYRSSAVDRLTETDLDDILHAARDRNQALSVTGCLHFEDGLFFQWIEGPAQAVGEVFQLIDDDPRHSDLTVLGQGPLDARRFQNWRMRYSDREHGSLMDWFANSEVATVDRKDYAGGVVAFLTAIAV